MPSVPSILMCVGKTHYMLHEVIEEYGAIGASKRISINSIPQGLRPGVSKIFIAHPDAIVWVTAEGKTLVDLAYELHELGAWEHKAFIEIADRLAEKPDWTGEELKAEDFVPEDMLFISLALSKLGNKDRSRLIKEYGLEFCMGIIGYSPFSAIQLVLPDGVDELPENLAHLEPYINSGVIQPVHVKYKD